MSIEWIGDSINDLSVVSMALRMVLSMVCSGVIGLERGRANQPAGMRTYMLVSLGASIVMITGDYLFNKYGTGDPARLGAQVVSGIGFLGAGSIVVSGKSRIRGLTTAAGLWTSACIGLVLRQLVENVESEDNNMKKNTNNNTKTETGTSKKTGTTARVREIVSNLYDKEGKELISLDNIRKVLNERDCIKYYALIVHDKDTYTETDETHKAGDLKAPHVHILMKFTVPQQVDCIPKWFNLAENFSQKVLNWKSALKYF